MNTKRLHPKQVCHGGVDLGVTVFEGI